MPREPARRRAVAVALALAGVAGCHGDGNDGAATTSGPTVTVARTTRESDGVLRLGVLLPKTGVGSQLGGAMLQAVGTAVARINDAGGVLGSDVVVVEADEGSDEATAAGGFDTLLRAGVDAIVGPASSLVALADLDAPVAEGVVTCSPTATAIALDDYPDDNLFFRTVPSDSMQALAIARVAEDTGARSVAIGHLDDPYGRAFAAALTQGIEDSDLDLVDVVGFDGRDDDLDEEAAKLLADDPGVVVVLGDADDGSRLVGALGQQLLDDKLPPTIIVSDALRSPASARVMQRLPSEVRERVIGVAPAAIADDDQALTEPYAAQAYDCVNLIALATAQAGIDDPERIAQQIPIASVGGSPCETFAECKQAIDANLQIDYRGPSGNTDLSSRTGDPTTARFQRFTFGANGLDAPGRTFDVRQD